MKEVNSVPWAFPAKERERTSLCVSAACLIGFDGMLTAQVIHDIDEKTITDTAFMEQHSYPQGWAYSDAQEYYAEMLKKPNNIPVILKDDGRNVGFLLAIPQDDAVEELESDDPLMERDSLTYYL